MRSNIDIDDRLMAEAQKASGQATKKATVEAALHLMIKLRRQEAVDRAFGKYRWRGNLGEGRKGAAAAARGALLARLETQPVVQAGLCTRDELLRR